MANKFQKDLAKAKIGENIVFQVLQGCTDKYEIVNVSNEKDYWHKGDFILNDVDEGVSYFLDVKDDSRIYDTHNLLAEHKVWYKNGGLKDGFMFSGYDYVAYLSQQDKIIYMLDFKLWQRYYLSKSDRHLNIGHGYQSTDAYLMSLDKARKLGIVIAEIEYDCFEDDNIYFPVEVKIL